MRIRMLAGDLSKFAGNAVYCEQLALRLAARGHEVTLVCFHATDALRSACSVVETGRSPRRNNRLVWRAAYYLDEAHCARSLYGARLCEADVVVGVQHLYFRGHHAIDRRTPFVYLPMSLVAPTETRSYDLSPITRYLSARLMHKRQHWALTRADATVRFTQTSCDALDDYYGRKPAGRYVVNAMPVHIPDKSAAPKEGAVRLLTIGRLVESKNVDLAIAKLAALKQYRWRFDVIGAGDRLEPMRAFVKSLGLQDRVFCQGRQPETESWLRQANLFLFTSRLDNCPVAVLEAMSYGVPVLAIRPNGTTYVSGIEELVEHGRTGILAADEDDFRRQLEAILIDPERLIPLAEAARRQVVDHHAWDAHLDRFKTLFERLAAG